VLQKILSEVEELERARTKEILNCASAVKWTNIEVAQLLVAVFNLGEGEWLEIQKRINFSSSGLIKTPNHVALKWRKLKRRLIKDTNKMSKSNKAVTQEEWILSTLRALNDADPQAIGLTEKHFEVL